MSSTFGNANWRMLQKPNSTTYDRQGYLQDRIDESYKAKRKDDTDYWAGQMQSELNQRAAPQRKKRLEEQKPPNAIR